MASGHRIAQHPPRGDGVTVLSGSFTPGTLANSQLWSVVTCCADGFAHAVPDATLAGVETGPGRMLAVCGRLIVPGALTSPVGPPCRLCPLEVDVDGQVAPRRIGAQRSTRRSRFWW